MKSQNNTPKDSIYENVTKNNLEKDTSIFQRIIRGIMAEHAISAAKRTSMINNFVKRKS
uniref:Uncharacterized protein n=1 Tax=Prevotella sp. GTC17262 TaxID=3236797 RepID=A0AB33JK86_9BACT